MTWHQLAIGPAPAITPLQLVAIASTLLLIAGWEMARRWRR